MSKYFYSPVIGIDVSEGFHIVSILDPKGDIYRKPFKISNSLEGFNYLVSEIKKVEKEFNMKSGAFMESTGVYHLSLFHFLKTNELEAFVINPLITNSNKNKDIRKVKNDKKDSLSIAKMGKFDDIKVSDYFDIVLFNLRCLCRDYYKQVDIRSLYKRKLSADLHIAFPGYSKAFKNITCDSSLTILKLYPSPTAFLKESRENLIKLLKDKSNKGLSWASNAYEKLFKAATEAVVIGIPASSLTVRILTNVSIIETLNEHINNLVVEMRKLAESDDFPDIFKRNILFLDSIPGIDFLSALTLLTEIGDIRRFSKPKQLIAFLGIDPSVNESGKFKSDRNTMSKRGSKIARRALYSAALVSIRHKRGGELFNQTLFDYYHNNLKDKKKKVAIGAVMHKLVNYTFAVLRDQKEFEPRSPKIHQQMYLNNQERKAS
jgi:transposase